MKCKAYAAEPGEAEITFTVTMRLNEWEQIASQIGSSSWSGTQLALAIRNVAASARKTLFPELESK